MKIFTGKIGSGKTVELIKKAYKKKGTLVVVHQSAVEAMKYCCKDMSCYYKDSKYNDIPVITYKELLARNLSGKKDTNKYFIDSIEIFLDIMFAGTIKGFIAEGENIIVKQKIDGKFSKYKLVEK